MIPRLPVSEATAPLYRAYLDALAEAGFAGDISTGLGERVVLSTDNSIYRRVPRAVLYPRHAGDVECLCRVAADARFRGIKLAPRGGGTGTNGQSLGTGVLVDLSRHMNKVVAYDPGQRRITVQAGVVKDQVDRHVAAQGLFFAPELSTGNRATVGGMVNTDASGQGSCRYGKTRDHVIELEVVALGGARWRSRVLEPAEEAGIAARDDIPGRACVEAARVSREQAGEIARRFPPLNRCLTGYDLAHLRDARGRLDLNSLFCGSEGTLVFVTEVTLKLEPLPRATGLLVVHYATFEAALDDAHTLAAFEPTSIETLDETVLRLARTDSTWPGLAGYFGGDAAGGVNLVEFTADSEGGLDDALDRACARLAGDANTLRTGFVPARGHAQVKAVWGLRRKAVGLLGRREGDAKPIPFVEDAAVPPEKLPAFVREFRGVLDAHGLASGMFGHVDAGVLHIRPAIDMRDPDQAALIRPVTDAVVDLVEKYGGVIWGEHGKGLRSEYVPRVFGPRLYAAMQDIKAVFDPFNQLNPGKICTPAGSPDTLLRIDAVPTRGEADRRAGPALHGPYGAALKCNGNAACYDFSPDALMCPSWKGSRKRTHSPQGRAALLREWLAALRSAGSDAGDALDAAMAPPRPRELPVRLFNGLLRRLGQADFSHEVMDSMAACLACKACATACPVAVDVPGFRARFLAVYHARYPRRLRQHLVARIEYLLPWLARLNHYTGISPASRWLSGATRLLGLVDLPAPAKRSPGAYVPDVATPGNLAEGLASAPGRCVVLVPDAFTGFVEPRVQDACCELLLRLGFRVYLAPWRPGGKPLHVNGYLREFDRVARENVAGLRALAQSGVPLVGLEPSVTLAYRDEYRELLGDDVPQVQLVQEWLATHLSGVAERLPGTGLFELLGHCTERSLVPGAGRLWQQAFAALGLDLRVRAVGCCGMAGGFGHESEQQALSRAIFEASWASVLKADGDRKGILATGFSCRAQVRRFGGQAILHPVEALLDHVRRHGIFGILGQDQYLPLPADIQGSGQTPD